MRGPTLVIAIGRKRPGKESSDMEDEESMDEDGAKMALSECVDAAKKGDWTAFGDCLDALIDIKVLRAMNEAESEGED